jgi:hypothetical protein
MTRASPRRDGIRSGASGNIAVPLVQRRTLRGALTKNPALKAGLSPSLEYRTLGTSKYCLGHTIVSMKRLNESTVRSIGK